MDGPGLVVDARGSPCPGPFVEVVKAFMKTRGKGPFIVLTDDEDCIHFIPEHASEFDFAVSSSEAKDGYYEIVMVRKD